MKNVLIIACTVLLAFGCNSQKKTTSTDARVPDNAQNKRANGGQRSGPPSVDEIFKMDTNNDNKLSKSEIKGPLLKDFSKIDSDGDGFISRTELENAPKPERGQRPQRNN